MDTTDTKTFAIYIRKTPVQMFSFREYVTATTAHEARKVHRKKIRRDLVLGVKEVSQDRKKVLQGGRWLA